MKAADVRKALNQVRFLFVAFLCVAFLFLGLALGHTLLRQQVVDWTAWVIAAATVALVVFAYFSAKGARETQRLQEKMVTLQDRFVWFVGAIESHTDMISKFLAREHDVPVIWWDPQTQQWPRKPKHGDVFRGEVVLTYLPVELRGSPDAKPIDVDALLRSLQREKQPARRNRGNRRKAAKHASTGVEKVTKPPKQGVG